MEKTFENWLVVSDIDGTLNNKIRTVSYTHLTLPTNSRV